MTTVTLGRWLFVSLTLVALAFAVPAVSAHGTDTTADDAPPNDWTASDWAAWMEAHVNDHMGPGSVEWMESHMGVTVDAMGRETAESRHAGGRYGGGMYGQGHC